MSVDDYINQQTSDHQQTLHWLRHLILTSDSGIREKISWNVPVYMYRKRPVCYLNVLRTAEVAVDLAFMQGRQLPDDAGLLESRGRKTVKSLVVFTIGDPDEDVVRTYVQEALLLNENRSL